MSSPESSPSSPSAGSPGSRNASPGLPAWLFYGSIIAGLILGIAVCVLAGWSYLQVGDRKPTGRRIWDSNAEDFVIPICAMIGATFGGLAGVGAAIAWDRLLHHHSDNGIHSITS